MRMMTLTVIAVLLPGVLTACGDHTSENPNVAACRAIKNHETAYAADGELYDHASRSLRSSSPGS
ncbi:MAG: hypothetical protein ACJ72E_05720, partial [Marmoricola sp.]